MYKLTFKGVLFNYFTFLKPLYCFIADGFRKLPMAILLAHTVLFSQTPSFSLGTNSKYYDFKETFVSNDFKQVSQLRIGPYLTLGNFGYTNNSWIGCNAVLDYSSYGDIGSQGNKNTFIPEYDSGTAFIMQMDAIKGNLEGYNHPWNHLSNGVDFLDFEQVWQIGKNTSFFLSNVGIGTTSPDSKLTVKGKIHAEEVRIDLSVPGPDYVFKEGYQLRSMEEVRQYIQKYGHLPNIPSAKEMEENGVELGIMNMKLLEKIEELTLYILGQDKKLEVQEEKILEMESKLNKLLKNKN